MARQILDAALPVGYDPDRKPIATLTLKSASSLSQTQANEIALWLTKLAKEIKSKERLNYSKRFTARFY